jgi:hypothetical protein
MRGGCHFHVKNSHIRSQKFPSNPILQIVVLYKKQQSIISAIYITKMIINGASVIFLLNLCTRLIYRLGFAYFPNLNKLGPKNLCEIINRESCPIQNNIFIKLNLIEMCFAKKYDNLIFNPDQRFNTWRDIFGKYFSCTMHKTRFD